MQRVHKDQLGLVRCGYTGEDGFEVSVPNQEALEFVSKLEKVLD